MMQRTRLAAWMLVLAGLGATQMARAEGMNGFVSAGGGFVMHTAAVESGSRINYKLEFARLPKYISAELRMGTGQNYTDFGGTLKGFYHFYFDEPTSSGTGISIGAGAGAMYSPSGSVLATAGFSSAAVGFTDIIVQPFVRFLWDSKLGVGGTVEVGLDWVPYRTFKSGFAIPNNTDSRMRFYISLGLAIGA